MLSIKFKDDIIKTYPTDKLMHIPLFKNMMENFKNDESIIPIDFLNSCIVDDLVHHKFIKFDMYDFDELFQATEFLMLYEKKKIRKQMMDHLIYLLLNNIDKVNLDNLHKYIYDDYKYLLSDIINDKPELVELCPFVTHLNYSSKNSLAKFNNLISLRIVHGTIKTFSSFSNLKNLKMLCCMDCQQLEDGCFDIFENLEILDCFECYNLAKPFNKNLRNLKELYCDDCSNLEDGCFDTFESLEILSISHCVKLYQPFNINLKNLNVLRCACCNDLEDNCFDAFENLEELYCDGCGNLIKPFNANLKNLKILECEYCDNLEDGCFDVFETLEELDCGSCKKLNKPFNNNLENLKKLNCTNLRDDTLAVFKNLEQLNHHNHVLLI